MQDDPLLPLKLSLSRTGQLLTAAHQKRNTVLMWDLLAVHECRHAVSVSPLCRTSFVADVQPSLDTIARFGEEVPAHKALRNCISLSLGRLPDLSWRRRPGRPRGRWIDQLRRDNSQPPADLWRQAINRGHSGKATQRSSEYATTWPDLTCISRAILFVHNYRSRRDVTFIKFTFSYRTQFIQGCRSAVIIRLLVLLQLLVVIINYQRWGSCTCTCTWDQCRPTCSHVSLLLPAERDSLQVLMSNCLILPELQSLYAI